MNAAYIYLQIYKLFDSITPLPVDCGQLCGCVCCADNDEGDNGMLLFPGEAEVLKLLKPDWATIDTSDMVYNFDGKTHSVKIAMCSGECDRYSRPLACRIFPLTPHLTNDGKLEVITDPRGRAVCPLAKADYIDHMDERFVHNIYRAFSLLMKSPHFRAFMEVYNDYINDFLRFFRKD
ncbi:MAG: hypothetical protein Q4G33_10295 [bacterium]|nr:hypothetical protein [bacterium]